MQVTPLVEAKLVVTNISHGVGAPGDEKPSLEGVQLMGLPSARQGMPGVSVVNANLNLAIVDPEMMNKLVLGKTYKVLIVAAED